MKIIILSWSNIALKQDGTNISVKRGVNLKRILVEQFANCRLPAVPPAPVEPLYVCMYVYMPCCWRQGLACFVGIGEEGKGERKYSLL